MADVALLAQQVQTAPNGYQVPGAQEIILKSVRAVIDGTNASGDFNVALQIISPSGAVMAEAVSGVKVAAGASAHATWFPNVNATNVGNGSGIQFDTDNEGGWLDITTNATDGLGVGFGLTDKSGGGINIYGESTAGSITIDNTNLGAGTTGGINISDQGDSGINIAERSDGGITIEETLGAGLGTGIRIIGSGPINIATDDTAGLNLRTEGVGGVTAISGQDTGFPFTLGGNSVTLRAGDDTSSGAGAIEVGAFAGASGAQLVELLAGDWTLGSPASLFPGLTALLSSSTSFWVARGDATIMFEVDYSGQVSMPLLPTVNPGGSGKLWNNGGVLNIT